MGFSLFISASYSHKKLDPRQHRLAINYFLRYRKLYRKSHVRRKPSRKTGRDRRLVIKQVKEPPDLKVLILLGSRPDRRRCPVEHGGRREIPPVCL